MWVRLSSIQPGERYLVKSRVDFLAAHRGDLLKLEPRIRIASTSGLPFKYYVIEGNKRLFVMSYRGVRSINIEVENVGFEFIDEYSSNLQAHKEGVRTFLDLQDRIVSARDYRRLMRT